MIGFNDWDDDPNYVAPKPDYCKACQEEDHDVCDMKLGCPCCEQTMRELTNGN